MKLVHGGEHIADVLQHTDGTWWGTLNAAKYEPSTTGMAATREEVEARLLEMAADPRYARTPEKRKVG